MVPKLTHMKQVKTKRSSMTGIMAVIMNFSQRLRSNPFCRFFMIFSPCYMDISLLPVILNITKIDAMVRTVRIVDRAAAIP